MAAFVSGEETSCEIVAAGADAWALIWAGVIGMLPAGVGNNRASKSPHCQERNERNRKLTKRRQAASREGSDRMGAIVRIAGNS